METASEPYNLGNGPVVNKGAFVTCTDLTYKIRVKRRQGGVKTILRDVDVYLVPGEMTVIMGPSGCGEGKGK
jgi:ABC-type transporter Mla maintaining outer membrane lipid asymmetry ATPase subunit MlaF